MTDKSGAIIHTLDNLDDKVTEGIARFRDDKLARKPNMTEESRVGVKASSGGGYFSAWSNAKGAMLVTASQAFVV